MTAAAATAIVRKTDRNLLADNGGPIIITTGWAKSVLYRLNFVKRRGSSAAKITVSNFEELKQQYLFDFKSVVVMDEIPPQLIFNWDHTGISKGCQSRGSHFELG
uniref:DDE-1 domain-containing protein n=1 Tax=Amphimedon queenslandica TaxID=400682 RepID=A0A1X7U6Q2_AMPQE